VPDLRISAVRNSSATNRSGLGRSGLGPWAYLSAAVLSSSKLVALLFCSIDKRKGQGQYRDTVVSYCIQVACNLCGWLQVRHRGLDPALAKGVAQRGNNFARSFSTWFGTHWCFLPVGELCTSSDAICPLSSIQQPINQLGRTPFPSHRQWLTFPMRLANVVEGGKEDFHPAGFPFIELGRLAINRGLRVSLLMFLKCVYCALTSNLSTA